MAGQELRDRVHAALDQLSPQDREILWMRHFDDLDYNDVSAVLGITPAAAMTRHARALRRIKSLLADLDSSASRGC
jgi:RNA polymerase sigma-70 factor (ECF subfamily)